MKKHKSGQRHVTIQGHRDGLMTVLISKVSRNGDPTAEMSKMAASTSLLHPLTLEIFFSVISANMSDHVANVVESSKPARLRYFYFVGTLHCECIFECAISLFLHSPPF